MYMKNYTELKYIEQEHFYFLNLHFKVFAIL